MDKLVKTIATNMFRSLGLGDNVQVYIRPDKSGGSYIVSLATDIVSNGLPKDIENKFQKIYKNIEESEFADSFRYRDSITIDELTKTNDKLQDTITAKDVLIDKLRKYENHYNLEYELTHGSAEVEK